MSLKDKISFVKDENYQFFSKEASKNGNEAAYKALMKKEAQMFGIVLDNSKPSLQESLSMKNADQKLSLQSKLKTTSDQKATMNQASLNKLNSAARS